VLLFTNKHINYPSPAKAGLQNDVPHV